MWNLVNMGYLPLKLVLGTAVYSLGVVGGSWRRSNRFRAAKSTI